MTVSHQKHPQHCCVNLSQQSLCYTITWRESSPSLFVHRTVYKCGQSTDQSRARLCTHEWTMCRHCVSPEFCSLCVPEKSGDFLGGWEILFVEIFILGTKNFGSFSFLPRVYQTMLFRVSDFFYFFFIRFFQNRFHGSI